MTEPSYVCLRCKKKFTSEEKVKRHLQWVHNIPPFEMSLQLYKVIEEFLTLDENREDA